jgi:two-component system, response regulator PdtaR
MNMVSQRSLNILVVEDDPIIAEDLRGWLLDHGHRVTGPAATCAAAKRLVLRERPDAAILDINLGGAIGLDGSGDEGCQLAEWLNKEHPIPFIYLSSHSDDATLARARETHPGGYLLKPFTGPEIRVALEVAYANFNSHRQERTDPLDLEAIEHILPEPLSIQEMRILQCVGEGLTNKATGERLFISENTVKTHLKHIFEKLNVHNRTEAIHKARMLIRS